MKNQENKLIADKINSLDQLPEGYHPNLDAKWALLQKENRKSPVVIFFSGKNLLRIAACLLIVLISCVWWMNRPEPVNNFVSSDSEFNVSQKAISSQIESQVEQKLVVRKENAGGSKIKNVSTSQIKQETIPVKEEKIIASIEDTATDTSGSFTGSVPLAVEAKKKKPHFVQMDFNEDISQTNNKNTFAQEKRFRIRIKNSEPIDRSSSESSSPFRIKSNF